MQRIATEPGVSQRLTSVLMPLFGLAMLLTGAMGCREAKQPHSGQATRGSNTLAEGAPPTSSTTGSMAPGHIKNTSASSTYCAGASPGPHCYSPERINDGDRSTALGGLTSWANDNPHLPQWVQWDFGSPRRFGRVELYTTEGYELQDYRLEFWNGSEWSVLLTVTGNTQVHRTHSFVPVKGSSLRVVGLRGPNVQPSYIRVNELEVYSD